MPSEMVRWGGLAGVVAGVMFLLSGILTFINAAEFRSAFPDWHEEAMQLVAERDTVAGRFRC